MGTENKARWIRWESKYKTGYKRIDEQHKELVNIINDLYSIGVESNIEDIRTPLEWDNLICIMLKAIKEIYTIYS